HNVDFAIRRMSGRYSPYGWMNIEYTTRLSWFETIESYNREIGITENDKVICLPDGSINTTLYFMNQKGWTGFGYSLDSNRIQEKIDMGASYLFIYDPELYENPHIKPFIHTKTGTYKGIDIY